WKRPAVQFGQAGENRQQVPQLAIAVKAPRAHGSHIGSETETQKVDVIESALLMFQAQHIARLLSTRDERIQRCIQTLLTEIAKKGVPRSERQKTQRRPVVLRHRKMLAAENPVYDLIGGAVAAHGDKLAAASRVGFPSNGYAVPGRGGFFRVDLDSRGPQLIKHGAHQLTAAPAPGRRIYYREVRVVHNSTTSDRFRRRRTSSANSERLIFMEAVRGKSLSQIK